MWLPWRWALMIAVVLGLGAVGASRSTKRHAPAVGAVSAEAARVFVLYSLWQLAGTLAIVRIDGARARGQQIWDLERTLWMPNEASLQRVVLPITWLVKSMNIYYATMHVGAMIAFLIWMFMYRRPQYVPVRRALVFLSSISLAIQLVPVAPPRLVPSIGMVDTAHQFGQSVYPSLGEVGPSQLSAMPSLHVGWAALVGVAVFTLVQSRWRWIGMAHAALTFVIVALTANHYWLDGVVDIVLLGGWLAIPACRWSTTHAKSVTFDCPARVVAGVGNQGNQESS